MKTFLEDIERFIEAEVETPVPEGETNVGDAPVEEDMNLKIAFTDLKDEKLAEIKDKMLKNMNATDETSKNNLNHAINSTPIFDGTVEDFKTQFGITENK